MTPQRRRELEARVAAKRRARDAEPTALTGTVRGIRTEATGPGARAMAQVTSPWCGVVGVQVRRRP